MYTVQVLLSTYNGAAYLREQLDSILNQKDVSVRLLVRDDGSSDETTELLRAYTALNKNMQILCGENSGVVASFFRLFELSDPDADFYALSDQDDVWDEDKLFVACSRLEALRQSKSSDSDQVPTSDGRPSDSDRAAVSGKNTSAKAKSGRKNKNKQKNKKKKEPVVPDESTQIRTFPMPLLYCCDAWNTDADLNLLPESMQTVGLTKVPDFRNALIENIARGASIVFNHALMNYVKIPMPQGIYMHDWWLYLTASCFGEVCYDSEAHYKYRQHTGNALGAAPSGLPRLLRRFRQSRTNGGHVSEQAKTFARIYHVPENKELYLNILTHYQDVPAYRKMGRSGEYLFRQNPKDQRIFRLMFRSNHL